ncbi:MAG: hypothetical protein WCR72_12260, partial [Bacteroidota bacterium]
MKKVLLKAAFIIAISLVFNIHSFAQTGGTTVYKFLSLTNSSRVAALGGNFLAINDHDLSLA